MFETLAAQRQSCRAYDTARPVEPEKLAACLEAARLSPSACNSQPYHFFVAGGSKATAVGECLRSDNMNGFTAECPLFVVLTEAPYTPRAEALNSMKNQDYRLIDIGIAAAQFTLQATDLGLGSCILGWFDEEKLQQLLGTSARVRLVLALGYPKAGDKLRDKKRKTAQELITTL